MMILYLKRRKLIIPYYNPVTKKFIDIFPDFIIKTSKASFMIEINLAKYLKHFKPLRNEQRDFANVEFIKNQTK